MNGNKRPIKLNWESYRPIQCAWCATREDWDLGDAVGFGATKAEAVMALIEAESMNDE